MDSATELEEGASLPGFLGFHIYFSLRICLLAPRACRLVTSHNQSGFGFAHQKNARTHLAQVDPNQRLTADQALKHEWVKECGCATEKSIHHRVKDRILALSRVCAALKFSTGARMAIVYICPPCDAP